MKTPNADRIWPAFIAIRDRTYKSNRPKCKYLTTTPAELRGFNSWHIVCLGILPLDELESFLDKTLHQRPGLVFDAMFEHISNPFPLPWTKHQVELSRLPDSGIGQDLVGLGIEELCRVQQLSLFGHYLHQGVMTRCINPGALIFEHWIRNELDANS